jgi:hypothetical protein
MSFDLGGLLQQYMGGNPAMANPQQAEDDFVRIADQAPQPAVASGVTEALRSDQTPPFPQMVSQLFGHGDPGQRAGMLNQLLGALGPNVMSVAGGLLGKVMQGHGDAQQMPQITPQQAEQVSPQEVEQIAAKAEQHNPGVIEHMGNFYAEHPTLVKSLGAAALAIAMGHIAQNMQQRH